MPPDCTFASSPFMYTLAGNVVGFDLHIINNKSLRDIFSRELKYWEPKSIKKNTLLAPSVLLGKLSDPHFVLFMVLF